jgi:hypothetical protein
MKNLIRAIAFSAALLISMPLLAQETHILLAPPALQTEVIPDMPFSGAVWQPGYYKYDVTLGNYTFVNGQWVSPPYSGATWIAPSYEFSNGEYLFLPGHWVGTQNPQIITTPRRDDTEEDQRERLERQQKHDIKMHDDE